MTGRYLLDRDNGKLMGVCAGLARWAQVDATLVRLTAVLLGLLGGPIVLVAYLATGLVAERA